MTWEDREVIREVWDGKIPTAFSLAEDEILQDEAPEPCYLFLPRMSYLPLATDKVKKYFSKFIEATDNSPNIWFEYKGIPLKWHHPIGILYDCSKAADEENSLPWPLTVHFRNFPQEELIPCQSREVVEAHFMSCLKEADQLKHAGKVMSCMQKKDHNQLWTGLQNDKFDQFWAINRRFMEPGGGEEFFKHIPVRFHMVNSLTLLQKLVKPVRDRSCQPLTLGDLAALVFPNSSPIFIVQGVRPASDTPLQWLSQHLSYPDNFLHIAVHL